MMWHLALIAAAAAGPAPENPKLSLFSERFYRGESQAFTADQPRLAVPISPQSLAIVGRWELCSGKDFEGR
jgi:hypothetical protein